MIEQQRALIFWKTGLGIWIGRSIGAGLGVSLYSCGMGLVIMQVDS